MIIGYARVSTKDQDLQVQIKALEDYGCFEIFEEKISTRKKDRPKLEELLKMLRPGDKVVVYKLDRIGRSIRHLLQLMDLFAEKGVEFVSIKDSIDTSTAAGRFFFNIMASVAEFERDLTSERTIAGLDYARSRGRNGGRPRVDPKKLDLALKMYDSKDYSIKEITEATGVSQATLYRSVNELRSKNVDIR